MMLQFGMSYKEIQAIIPAGEFELLRKAWYITRFGYMQDYYLSGHLLSTIGQVAGGKPQALHKIYPHIFEQHKKLMKADDLDKLFGL